MSLNVSTTMQDDTYRVMVCGEVDVSNAKELRGALDEALDSAAHAIVADLSQVAYIDSTGIGVLVGTAHRASDAGKSFAVEQPQRNVRRVLAMLGVDKELGIQ